MIRKARKANEAGLTRVRRLVMRLSFGLGEAFVTQKGDRQPDLVHP